jgi:histidinol dehydrogenase
MLKTYDPAAAAAGILKRPDFDETPESPAQKERSRAIFGEALSAEDAVRRILRSVRSGGDAALAEWTMKLDGVHTAPGAFRVGSEVVKAAYALVPATVVEAMRRSAERITAFHRKQPAISWMDSTGGGILGQKVCPIGRVGCYVPGGSAPLASTLLMTALVARAAGVPSICVCTPPDRRTGLPAAVTLVAADIAGVGEIYAVGGAQAIGAMAFGTESIQRVDKICGPGNTFVVLAKRQVYGTVGIDSLPGPTETAVVADDSADPALVAADMLAQSEHVGGAAVLFTPSSVLIAQVAIELERQTPSLATAAAIRESFDLRGGAVLTADLAEAVRLADEFAPEHLCLSVRDPWAWVPAINRAGGVFLGEHSYEVLGDYVAGPSHVMPTGGTARFTSPCNVLDFVRVMNIIALDESTALDLAPAAVTLAESEGLAAHANAARIRLGRG